MNGQILHFYTNIIQIIHLQSQLLKGLDRVERRVGILLKNFHLIGVLDKITSYQFV